MNNYHKGEGFMEEVINRKNARGSDLAQGTWKCLLEGLVGTCK